MMLRRCALAVLTLGLWACAGGEWEEPLPVEAGQSARELMQAVGPLQQARYQHSSTRLQNGKVLYAGGGTGSSSPPLASAELYDPATGTTTLVAPMNTARRGHEAVLLADGSVLVTGGITSAGVTASVERYSPSTNTWAVLPAMPHASYGHTTTLLADGRVLRSGGSGSHATAYLFDPNSQTWTATGTMVMGRMFGAAVRLPDNRVLVINGSTPRTEDRNHVELYDPATGTWSERARTQYGEYHASAVLLPNGRVVANDWSSAPSEYDVTTNTWTRLPAYNRGHHGGELVYANGALLVVSGGFSERSIERFDSALGRWDLVGELSVARNDIGVNVLPNGSVLIAGGSQTNTYVPYATMDLYSDGTTCVPRTCSGAGAACGTLTDGCGGTLQCGTCGTGYVCSPSNQCAQPPPDFTLAPTVSSRTIARGGWARYPITTSGSGSIRLSVSGLPAGSGAHFGAWDITAGSSTYLEVQTMPEYVAGGRYTLTITGTSGTVTRSATVTLIVTSTAGVDPILNGGFESGTLTGWSGTGTVSVGSSAHSGSFTSVLGSTTSPLAGDSTLSQTFTVPANGALLRYWFYGHAVDAPSDYASILLRDNTTGVTTPLIAQTYARPPYQEWLDAYANLTDWAGRSVTLTFVNHEAGWGSPTYTWFDDVSLLVPGDFTVGLSPATRSVQAGTSAVYTVITNGQGTLTLSAIGLPAGATATFSPATVTAGQSATLTVSTTSSTPVGTFSFTLQGTDSVTQERRSASAQLGVTAPPQTGSSFFYSASNTNSAQQNTTNQSVYLNAGQTLRVGTCTVAGASGSGDTYLRVYGVSATQVAANDDSCGLLSFLSYTATVSGTYQIRAGCYSSNSCSGTVAYTIQ